MIPVQRTKYGDIDSNVMDSGCVNYSPSTICGTLIFGAEAGGNSLSLSLSRSLSLSLSLSHSPLPNPFTGILDIGIAPGISGPPGEPYRTSGDAGPVLDTPPLLFFTSPDPEIVAPLENRGEYTEPGGLGPAPFPLPPPLLPPPRNDIFIISEVELGFTRGGVESGRIFKLSGGELAFGFGFVFGCAAGGPRRLVGGEECGCRLVLFEWGFELEPLGAYAPVVGAEGLGGGCG